MKQKKRIVILISANIEWDVVVNYFPNKRIFHAPLGEWFSKSYIDSLGKTIRVIFFHGGWGKVAASASTQYVISRWKPEYLINLGTCGGFANKINKFDIIMVERTLIYDIYEQMGDVEEHIKYYEVNLDNSWVSSPYPIKVTRSLLVSADRDLFIEEIGELNKKYGAIAGDWESGAIAWVSKKNNVKCLILRGVTDLVNEQGGEAYDGNMQLFIQNTEIVMKLLIDSLPDWLLIIQE